jgi:tyrosine-protein kinase Etk/Wzc
MQQKDKKTDDSVVTLTDLYHIFKTHRVAILFGTLFCCLLAAGFSLARPVLYNIEGTFKDKGKSNSGISTLSFLLNTGNNQTEGEALATIKSRKFLEKLIYRRGLQGMLIKLEPRFDLFGSIPDNLLVEYAHFMYIKKPVLPDRLPTIWLQDVAYNDEVSKSFTLQFINEEAFEIFDMNNNSLGQNELGVKFKGDDFAFTVLRKSNEQLAGTSWYLELMPLQTTAELLMNTLTIQADQNDRNLLHIKLLHTNRHVGTEILNSMMLIYQEYIRQEQKRISKEQIAYLEKRQLEMGHKLRSMMTDHANNMTTDISKSGFLNSFRAIEFYSASQSMYQQKLYDIELAINRLNKAQEEGYAFYDVHGDPGIINQALAEIRSLKQQSDTLDIALKNTLAKEGDSFQETFTEQLLDLENVKCCYAEANLLLKALEDRKTKLPPTEKLLNDPKYAVKAWQEKLLVAQNNIDNAFSTEEAGSRKSELKDVQNNFLAYLKNLIHLLNVQEKIIQERLAFQQSPHQEFQGVDLVTSRELYLTYNRSLNEVQTNIRQFDFMIEQLKKPDFEVSSLSSIQNDSVTNEMVAKASQIVQMIKDQNNRSLKEIERLKEQLIVQKEFLNQHLNQALLLQKLKEQLIKEKITSLQSVTLDLLRQQISILEKHMQEYITMRLKDLQQETSLIEQHQDVLRTEMKDLPLKWMEERLIDQQLLINQKMVEEITSLVESKNLSSNLEILQSYPQDFAVPPIHPKSPRSLLFAAFGAFAGAFITFTFFIVRSALFGIRVSEANLKANQLHVSGFITQQANLEDEPVLLDQDLDTLRRLIAYMTSGPEKQGGQTLLLLNGAGVDYSRHLVELLAKRGLKVLLMPIAFKTPDKNGLSGMIQYLEGSVEMPLISPEGDYDCVYEGGVSRFAVELIDSPRFKKLIKQLSTTYDWIVVSSDVMPASGQADALIKLFDHAAVNLTHENINELKAYMPFKYDQDAKKKVSFIFSQIPG